MRLYRFNIYLCAAALLAMLAAGCRTDKDPEKKKGKEVTYIDLHMETPPDGMRDNEAVPVFRADPQWINVSKDAFLDNKDLLAARIVTAQDGTFAIELKFNERGQWLLDMNSIQNRDKRVVIHCKWTEDRWVASTVIRKRITDGVFTFTPDATKEEAERIVKGLNNIADELKKREKEWF